MVKLGVGILTESARGDRRVRGQKKKKDRRTDGRGVKVSKWRLNQNENKVRRKEAERVGKVEEV